MRIFIGSDLTGLKLRSIAANMETKEDKERQEAKDKARIAERRNVFHEFVEKGKIERMHRESNSSMSTPHIQNE